MKVIKHGSNHWEGLQEECPRCHAVFLIEETDVFLVDKAFAKKWFAAQCPECPELLEIPRGSLPAHVQQVARNHPYRGPAGG